MRSLYSGGIFLWVMIFSAGAFGASETSSRRFTVQLHVLATGTSQESVVSDLTSALKNLKDVDVTTDGTGLWLLYLNVTPITDRKGIEGYTISTVIADQYASKTLNELPSSDFTAPEAEETVKKVAKEQVDIRDHLMLTCTPDGLPKAYGKIVDYFDQTYLMPVREDIDNYQQSRSIGIRRGY